MNSSAGIGKSDNDTVGHDIDFAILEEQDMSLLRHHPNAFAAIYK